MGDAKEALYIRVKAETKEGIEKLRGTEGHSVNEIITRVIENFLRLPTTDQREILDGGGADAIGKTSELIKRLAWAEHAFGQSRWEWAIDEYARLAAESAPMSGTWALAQHKLGFCYVSFAFKLRDESLNEKDADRHDSLLQAADWCLRASIAFGERYETRQIPKGKGRHPVVDYNVACAWALRARYRVERALGPGAIKQAASRPEDGAANGVYGWRESLRERDIQLPEVVEVLVKRFAREAFSSLERVGNSDYPEPPGDVSFLLRLARQDPDFRFLRSDPEIKNSFESLLSGFQAEDVLETFSRLRDATDPEIRSRASELE